MSPREVFKRAIQETAFVRSSPERRIVNRVGSTQAVDPAWLFDFRAIILQPDCLNAFAELFWETFSSHYPFQVGGPETAGIPLVTAIVMKGIERGTPVNGFYIRKSRKREGLMKTIEGTLTKDPVILVDDLINSGGTLYKQMKVLTAEGYAVSDLFGILAFRPVAAYAAIEESGARPSWLYTLEDFGLPLLQSKKEGEPGERFSTVWRFAAGHPSHEYVVPKSGPVTDEQHVYFGSDDGIFWALDKKDGAVVWQYKTGFHPRGKGIFSTPLVHEGSVFFGAYDGSVYALDAQTGAKRWEYSAADWVGSSPDIAAHKGLLYIGLEFGLFRKRGGIAALRLDTGKEVWSARTPELTHCSPLYIREQDMVVIGSNDSVLYAYDAETGTEKWRFQAGGEFKSRFAYDSERHYVYAGSHDGSLYALRAGDGSLAFSFRTDAMIFSTPLFDGARVYVTSLGKAVYAIDPDTGMQLWVYRTNGRIFSSPVLFDGSLWVGSNDGCLYELDPERGLLKGKQQFTEKIVNAIAFDKKDRALFVPTCANEMYRIERL